MKLFDTTLDKLQSSLDVRLRKQNVLQSNIANVDTPGYQAKNLDFEQAMANAVAQQTQPVSPESQPVAEGEIPLDAAGPTPANDSAVHTDPGQAGLDGNGVDLDRTMVQLAQNGLLYGAAANTAKKKLQILKFVASDGAA
ncbi:MAG: flagellar basal body rod protein FlgB [Myxococcaceae bacterium]